MKSSITPAFLLLNFSEFFNKGPRPRRKDEEHNNTTVAGVELVDTTANHAQPGVAPMAKPDGDCTSRSLTSIDRTPPNSVGALACFRNAKNAGFSLPFLGCWRKPRRQASQNDDSLEFVSHRNITLHETPHSKSSYVPNEALHALYCETDVDGACYVVESDKTNVSRELQNTRMIHDTPTQSKHGGLRSHAINSVQVNPVPKPGRADSCVMEVYQREAPVTNNASFDLRASIHGKQEDEQAQRNLSQSTVEPNTKIVYLNREASETDNSDEQGQPRKDSFAEMLDTLLDKKLTVGGIDIGADKDFSVVPSDRVDLDEEKMMQKAVPVLMMEDKTKTKILPNRENNNEESPLLRKSRKKFRRSRPPHLVHLKSDSLEQAQRGDNYDSDDSIGNACSLLSHTSTLSRLSRLSIATCPSVRIDPKEPQNVRNRDSKVPLHQIKGTSSLPHRTVNIGFVTYSSVDTSENCDSSSESLSPRSLPSENTSQPLTSTPAVRNGNVHSDKSTRNVAIGSLKSRGRYKSLLKSDEDSGRESLSKGINGSLKQFDEPSCHQIEQLVLQNDSLLDSLDDVENEEQMPLTGNSCENEESMRSAYFSQDVKLRRSSLQKQTANDFEYF